TFALSLTTQDFCQGEQREFERLAKLQCARAMAIVASKRIGFPCGPIHVLADQSFPTLAINSFTVSGNVRNPLFPGKNIVHQLDMMNDLLGTPFVKLLEGSVRNEKAGRYLRSMRLKKSIRFSHKLPHDDPLDLRILQKLLSFELNERPTFEEGLVLTLVEYFKGLRKRLYMSSQRDPSVQPVTKLEFEFERLKITKEAMPELIYSILRLLLSTTQRC
ncbi:LOW QUALITY PROTEIN: hypothetical protein HID58_089200, partial [Brassica napus]